LIDFQLYLEIKDAVVDEILAIKNVPLIFYEICIRMYEIQGRPRPLVWKSSNFVLFVLIFHLRISLCTFVSLEIFHFKKTFFSIRLNHLLFFFFNDTKKHCTASPWIFVRSLLLFFLSLSTQTNLTYSHIISMDFSVLFSPSSPLISFLFQRQGTLRPVTVYNSNGIKQEKKHVTTRSFLYSLVANIESFFC
jgi:hypothetical protein